MNSIITADICLNGITMSTDEYSLGHFSLSGNGNITSETVDGQTIRYEYDEQNRLTHYFDPIAYITRIYTYDDRGNILDMKYCEYMTEEEYTAFVAEYGLDILESNTYTYGDSTWADLLTKFNGTSITYDELGNPLNWVGGRGITLTWENGRQLKQYKRGAVQQYDYTYNADGLRTGKTITQSGNVTKQTEYYIVNGQYIGEVSTVNGTQYVISYVYDENGAPAGINVNGSAYYFAKNLHGDIVAIMSYTGNVIAKYHYDAWGDLISITDGNGNAISSSTHIAKLNPFRYRGYMYDEETGFYYVSSRYYDPEVGRWLNADGLVSAGTGINGYNMFAYCNNNPVNYYDPSGMSCICLTKRVRSGHVCKDDNPRALPQPEPCPPLEPIEMIYYGELTDDQKVLVATIAAEATVTLKGTSVSWQGRQAMANVALNRVGNGEWAKFDSVSEICEFTGFDGYGNSNYQSCMNYLNNRDMSNATYESIIWDVMCAYCSDITNGCQLYFTPAAMTNASGMPNWNYDLLTEENIPGVDPYYEGRFYRYK